MFFHENSVTMKAESYTELIKYRDRLINEREAARQEVELVHDLWKKDSQKLTKRIDELADEVVKAEEQQIDKIADLERQLDAVIDERDRARSRRDEIQRRLDRHYALVNGLQDTCQKNGQTIVNLENELNERESEIVELNKKVEYCGSQELRDRIDILKDRCRSKQSVIGMLTADNAASRNALAKKDREFSELHQHVASLNDANESLKKEASDVSKVADNYYIETLSLRKRVATLENTLHDIECKIEETKPSDD